MKIIRVRRAGAISASVLLTTGVVYAAQSAVSPAPSAVAAPAAGRTAQAPVNVPAAAGESDPSELAAKIVKRLGKRTAGAFIDKRGRPVVTVTRAKDAATVRSLGAEPKVVARDGATLTKISDSLRREVGAPGTAWSVDPATAQVVVSADSTYAGAKLAGLRTKVQRHGQAVRLERMPGKLSLYARTAGGDAIYGGGYRCSLGFNVHRGSTYYFLTAGHCTNEAVGWYFRGGTVMGSRAGTSFPGNDYGIVRYTNPSITKSGMVNLYNGTYRDLTGAGSPVVGASVWRSGSTTGVHSGVITGTNATVNYWEGSVYGMIETSVCAEPGDSGGPLFRGKAGLGLTSGGSGDCTDGGVTFFQPVIEPMKRYRVQIY